MEGTVLIELSILLVLLIVLRFIYLIYKVTTGNTATSSIKRKSPTKTVICIGSGGHTTEIVEIVKQIDFDRYNPRYYILAASDTTSTLKVLELEKVKESNGNDYKLVTIPRSRIVGQSYITSIATTLYSILYSIPIMVKIRPDLILCNGPGTCIPICCIAFILKAAFICDTRIVFIESFCRTKTLSLTGKILVYMADNFVVQWPYLKRKVKRAMYIGQLI